ncbi:MAG: hypothetical protein H6651_04310 [Ardenticatenales bacterium]|nr:hypothetical protein [Ardenticatenales bacterium]
MKHLLTLLFALGLLACLAHTEPASAAAPELAGVAAMQVLDQVGGAVTAIAFDGDLAFVAQGPRLYSLAMTGLGEAQQVGYSPVLGGIVEGLLLVDGYAYVAAGYAGLYKLDITNPADITIVEQFDTPGFAARLHRQADWLYLADWSGGLLTFALPAGISSPAAIYQPGPVLAVTGLGEDVLIGLGFAGVQRLQMQGAGQPHLMGSAAVTAWDLLVAGDTVLVDAGVDGGIQLYANQPGGALAWQAELPSLTGLSAWGSLGEMAWLARSDGALLALDLSEAGQPALTTIAADLGPIAVLAFWQDQLLLGSEEDGLLWLEQPTNGPAVPVAEWILPSRIEAVAARGNFLFAASGHQGLQVMPRQAVMNPVRLALPGNAADLVVDGDYAYVAGGPAGLLTVNIQNPLAPQFVAQFNLDGAAVALTIYDHYLLVAARMGGLYLFDIAVPGQPQLLDHYASLFEVMAVEVAGGYVYIANQQGVEILALVEPGEIHYRYNVPTPGFAVDLTVAGGRLYIADWQGLQLVDVRNLNHIIVEDYLSLPGQVRGVAVQADQLYVALGEAGVAILETTEFKLQATFDSAGVADSILPSGAQLLVADQQGGLLQLEQSDFQYRVFLPLITTP